jgi:hypothetical protein
MKTVGLECGLAIFLCHEKYLTTWQPTFDNAFLISHCASALAVVGAIDKPGELGIFEGSRTILTN